MKSRSYLFFLFAALFSLHANSHVKLLESIPAKGAVLQFAPEQLKLKFNASSRIAKLKIYSTSGEKVDVGFKPTKMPNENFSWTLPVLSPGTYQVEIIYFGKDGHKMKANYSFTLQ